MTFCRTSCFCLCMCVLEGALTHVNVCEARGWWWNVFSGFFIFFFETQYLIELPESASCWPASSQDAGVSSSTGVTAHAPMPGFLQGCWGSELGSSCLCSHLFMVQSPVMVRIVSSGDIHCAPSHTHNDTLVSLTFFSHSEMRVGELKHMSLSCRRG